MPLKYDRAALLKIEKFFDKLLKELNSQKFSYRMWQPIFDLFIACSPDGKTRGRLDETLRQLVGSSSANLRDTSYLPDLKSPITPESIALGRQEYKKPEGNRIEVEADVELDSIRQLMTIMQNGGVGFRIFDSLVKMSKEHGATVTGDGGKK